MQRTFLIVFVLSALLLAFGAYEAHVEGTSALKDKAAAQFGFNAFFDEADLKVAADNGFQIYEPSFDFEGVGFPEDTETPWLDYQVNDHDEALELAIKMQPPDVGSSGSSG